MGADAVVVYFGLRLEFESTTDASADITRQLEENAHPSQLVARKVGLQTYFGRVTDGGESFLLVGTKVGSFGLEGSERKSLSEAEIAEIARVTRERLHRAGFSEVAALHIQLEAKY